MANDIGRGVSNGLIQLEEKIEKEVHTINANGERSFQEDFQFPNTERLLGGMCAWTSSIHSLFNALYLFAQPLVVEY